MKVELTLTIETTHVEQEKEMIEYLKWACQQNIKNSFQTVSLEEESGNKVNIESITVH